MDGTSPGLRILTDQVEFTRRRISTCFLELQQLLFRYGSLLRIAFDVGCNAQRTRQSCTCRDVDNSDTSQTQVVLVSSSCRACGDHL